jgi:hypothetical protein
VQDETNAEQEGDGCGKAGYTAALKARKVEPPTGLVELYATIAVEVMHNSEEQFGAPKQPYGFDPKADGALSSDKAQLSKPHSHFYINR